MPSHLLPPLPLLLSPPLGGCNIEGEEDSWDFGTGAGFYVDATEPKWSKNYNMYSYITQELPAIVHENFCTLGPDSVGVFGHSMGGHGALICALKNPGMFKVRLVNNPLPVFRRPPFGLFALCELKLACV